MFEFAVIDSLGAEPALLYCSLGFKEVSPASLLGLLPAGTNSEVSCQPTGSRPKSRLPASYKSNNILF